MKFSKHLLNISLFSFGLSLAIVLVQSRYFIPESELSSTARHSLQPLSSEPFGLIDNVAIAQDVAHDSESAAAERAAEIKKLLTPEMFVAALNEGTLESLQIIRPEWIRSVKDANSNVIRIVNRQALQSLLAKFSDSDWTDWPQAALNVNGKPTPARRFIDDVRTVNHELGNYLETAAILFFNLRKKTLAGELYNLESDLSGVLLKAETLLALRNRPAIPARSFLDDTINTDSDFVSVLEAKRSEFLVIFIKENPGKLREQLILLAEIKGEGLNDNIIEATGSMLRNIALDGSPITRSKLIEAENETQAIQKLAKQDAKINRTLAQLYLLAALDALERQDEGQAEQLLKKSLAVESGLSSQNLLRQKLDSRKLSLKSDLKKQPRVIEKRGVNRAELNNEDVNIGEVNRELQSNEELLAAQESAKGGIAFIPLFILFLMATFVCTYFYRTRYMVRTPPVAKASVMNEFKAEPNEYLSLDEEQEGELQRTRSASAYEQTDDAEDYQPPKSAIG